MHKRHNSVCAIIHSSGPQSFKTAGGVIISSHNWFTGIGGTGVGAGDGGSGDGDASSRSAPLALAATTAKGESPGQAPRGSDGQAGALSQNQLYDRRTRDKHKIPKKSHLVVNAAPRCNSSAIGLRGTWPCVTSPRSEINFLEATQLRLCLLSETG